MFSIPYALSHLYPDKSPDDINALSEQCIAQGVDYISPEWKDVKREALGDPLVKLHLVRTLFESQFSSYTGVVTDILLSLEQWSEDGALVFLDFPPEEQDFFQRYYGFLAFVNIGNLPATVIAGLLRSRFLVLAAGWDIPIYPNVQDYFRRYVNVVGLKDDATLFALGIALNATPIGEIGRGGHPLAEWVKKFNAFWGQTVGNKVDEFFAGNLETDRLDKDVREVLAKILTLYFGLQTSAIWMEITGGVPAAGFELTDKKPDNKKIPDYYLEKLRAASPEDFNLWLGTASDVVEWIAATDQPETFVGRLLCALSQKIDLGNSRHVEAFLKFIEALRESGWEIGADLVYFDEPSGQMRWNKDVIDALKGI